METKPRNTTLKNPVLHLPTLPLTLQGHLGIFVFCLSCTLLLVFGVQGWTQGRVNNFHDQSIQLPIIYSYADSTLFQGDFLLKARATYVTYFYPLMGYASRYIELSTLMLGLYIVATAITVSGIFTLGETLFPRKKVGYFAVLFWMAYLPNLGGDYIHSPFVTHSTLAISLVLWAIVLILRRHYTYAAMLLGAVANINAMTSTFVVFMWFFALLLDYRQWSWRLIRIPLVMGIMALPVLAWRLSLPLMEASLDDFVEIIRLRLWYAVFPFALSKTLWLGTIALWGLWFFSWRYGKPTQHTMVLRMVAGVAVLCTIATIFSELIPLEFVIELQLIRSAWLINLFIIFYLANMVSTWLRDGRALWAIGLIVALALPRIIVGQLLMTHPTPYLLYVDFAPPYRGDILPELVLSVGILAAIFLYTLRRELGNDQRMLSWFGIGLFCFVLPAFIDRPMPAAQQHKEQDWRDTLVWVEANTPKDARFMTPPDVDGFRVIAKRPHLGDWKDGTVGIFNNGWAIEWRVLMRDLGLDEAQFRFHPLTQSDVCHVREKYAVDYMVVYQDWGIEGEAVYQNERFAVMPATSLNCAAP